MGKYLTIEQLKERQEMSLQDKIDMSCERIEQWYNDWNGMVYVAFSGGKDSTVLLDLVRNKAFIPDAKDVPAVYFDTGLEYPETREFVRTFDNVVILRPKATFKQVIDTYGYALISKQQSALIEAYRNTKSEKRKKTLLEGNESGKAAVIYDKWKFMIDSPFKISPKCCDMLKKEPAYRYEKETGRYGFVGMRADESRLRTGFYLNNGCNIHSKKHPFSMPLAFWTEKDIYEYLDKYNLPRSKLYDMGYSRQGCMFCMFGVDLEVGENRFQKMARTHPQMYKYCMEKLNIGEVLNYMNIEYRPIDQLEKIEEKPMEDEKPKKKDAPKLNSRDELLTPKYITHQLGEFDLDPCASRKSPWQHSKKQFFIEDDGLKQEWQGRVWLHPPSRYVKEFMKKLKEHRNGIAHLYTGTETNLFFDYVWNDADAIFFFKGRIPLSKENREEELQPPAGTCLIAYGKNNVEALKNSNLPGKLVILKD